MLTWRGGLLVVVFKKAVRFLLGENTSCHLVLSHRFIVRTSLDCGKKEIQSE